MTEKLIVPEYVSYRRDAEALAASRKKHDAFEFAVHKLLDQELPAGWHRFIIFRFTEDFFSLRQLIKHDYRRPELARFKRGRELKFKPGKLDEIRAWVDRCLDAEAREKARESEFERVSKLLAPTLAAFDDDSIKTVINEHDCSLTVKYGKRGAYAFDTEASVTIERGGSVSEPMAKYNNNVRTLSAARKFIDEFLPLHNRLLAVADEIVRALPDGYWIKTKGETE